MTHQEHRYDPASFEKMWQKRWQDARLFHAQDDSERDPFYVLEMFPYPSGHMHMGHVRVYAIGDVLARYMRMQGKEVLHPMGFDAFGLPAENAAIKEGVHPALRTKENIASFKGEMVALGYAYDWEREFATCNEDYYRWNQWFFLRLYEKGLVYRREAKLNWCPSCATVLANEQVEDGKCWRCASEVQDRQMSQWAFRITAYAEELLEGLDQLKEWPDRILTMQRNWMGRSEGMEVEFAVVPEEGDSSESPEASIRVFTTRGDTIYGATYLVLAPDHALVNSLCSESQRDLVNTFIERVKGQEKTERTNPESEKEGVFIGRYARNPFTQEKIPIWAGNFVLAEYGTGAIMSVPAHDSRDFRFAKKYGIPIKVVIQPSEGEPITLETLSAKGDAFTEEGTTSDSGPHSKLPSDEARRAIASSAEEGGFGSTTVAWHLRDWGISRQRYWGTPIPFIHCEKDGLVPVPDAELPVRLPDDVVFQAEGGSPLERCEGFVNTTCPKCGEAARRETDTMDTFVDSSWYYARYCDALNTGAPFSKELANRYLPVDVYVGGPEHAVMHLLYFRFWHKVMRDLKLVSGDEPVKRLVTQGIVMKGGAKMSKSLGNVVSPTEMIERFGADTVRMFMLFAAPPEKDIDWNDDAVEGQHRFLARVYRLVMSRREEVLGERAASSLEGLEGEDRESYRVIHKTIAAVTRDIGDRLIFNTAIARIMELVNHLYAYRPESKVGLGVLRLGFERLACLLYPFAPHLGEELAAQLNHEGFLLESAWPSFDPSALVDELCTYAVSVNGKVRGTLQAEKDAAEESVKAAAREVQSVARHLEGKQERKVIFVPGRLVNFVVG